MKDVLTALTSEVFKPLMTVVLPGAVSISSLLVALFLRFQGLRMLTDSRRFETVFVISLLALIAGEIAEDIGSRIEHWFDVRLKRQLKDGKLEYPQFDEEWNSYLRFAAIPEPVGFRYIRALVLRLKFELGMGCGFLACGLGLFAVGLPECWLLGLNVISLSLFGYFLWEASETHEVLAETRHVLFGANSPGDLRRPADETGTVASVVAS